MNEEVLNRLRNKWLMRWYYILHLPGAYFFGLKVHTINFEKSVIAVPYRWSTKNPFQSIYFAALTAAAELSTGVLALAATDGKSMSMLVTKVQGEFIKKAKGVILFECNEVAALIETVNKANNSDQGHTISLKSTGRDLQGEPVAVFNFEWSFRKKAPKK